MISSVLLALLLPGLATAATDMKTSSGWQATRLFSPNQDLQIRRFPTILDISSPGYATGEFQLYMADTESGQNYPLASRVGFDLGMHLLRDSPLYLNIGLSSQLIQSHEPGAAYHGVRYPAAMDRLDLLPSLSLGHRGGSGFDFRGRLSVQSAIDSDYLRDELPHPGERYAVDLSVSYQPDSVGGLRSDNLNLTAGLQFNFGDERPVDFLQVPAGWLSRGEEEGFAYFGLDYRF